MTPVRGDNEDEYLTICADTIVFFSVDSATRKYVSSSRLQLDVDECFDVSTSRVSQKVYAVCKKGETLKLLRIDIVVKSVDGISLDIKQDEGSAIKNNIRIKVGDGEQGAEEEDSVYIWENKDVAKSVAFRRATFDKGTFTDEGYFSPSKSNINIGKGNKISTIHQTGKYLIVITQGGADEKNYNLYRCTFNKQAKKFECDEADPISGADSGSALKIVKQSTAMPRITAHMILSISTKGMGFADLSVENLLVGQWVIVDISKDNLESVSGYQQFGKFIYAVGEKTVGEVKKTALVKVDPDMGNYNVYLYDHPNKENPTATKFTVVVNDPYERQNSYVICGSGTTLNTFKVIPPILEIDTSLTGNPEADSVKGTIKVLCKSDTEAGSVTLNLAIQTKAYRGGQIKLPDNSWVYASSKKAFIALNQESVFGNAATYTITGVGDKKEKLNFRLDYVSEESAKKKPTDIKLPLTGLKHIGDNLMLVSGSEKSLALLKVDYIQDKKETLWTKPESQITVESGYKLVAAYSEQGALVTLKTVIRQDDKTLPKSVIEVVALSKDGTVPAQKQEYDLTVELAAVRIVDGNLHIIAVGKDSWDKPYYVYHFKYNILLSDPPKELIKLRKIGDHFCPKEMSWLPRAEGSLLISSSCGDKGVDSHIFTFELSFSDPSMAAVTSVYRVENTKDFSICAQHDLVNVIDRDRDVVYSFDLHSGVSAYHLPVQAYGYKHVDTHVCDQDNDVLQVIACKDDTRANCGLLTFRANVRNAPNRRVHSHVQLPSQVSFLASTYSYSDDVTLTVHASKDSGELWARAFYIMGPHFILDATQADEKLDAFQYIVKATYFTGIEEGVTPVVLEKESVLQVRKQTETVSISIQKDKKKLKSDGNLIDLEPIIKVDGPFHRLSDKSLGDVTLNDRLGRSSQYPHTPERFDDMTIHKNWVAGIRKKENNLFFQVIGPKNFTKMLNAERASLKLLEDGKKIYFFVHVSTALRPDKLLAFSWEEGADRPYDDFEIEMPHGFVDLQITTIAPDTFFLSGYNNELGGMVFVQTFEAKNAKARVVGRIKLNLGGNLAEFDHVKLPKGKDESGNTILLLASKQYSDQINMIKVTVTTDGYINYSGIVKKQLIPDLNEAHENVAFQCALRDNTVVRCVIAGKNMYSYVVEYTIGEGKDFVTASSKIANLLNVVNLVPRSCDLSDNFIVFLADNRSPLKENSLGKR